MSNTLFRQVAETHFNRFKTHMTKHLPVNGFWKREKNQINIGTERFQFPSTCNANFGKVDEGEIRNYRHQNSSHTDSSLTFTCTLRVPASRFHPPLKVAGIKIQVGFKTLTPIQSWVFRSSKASDLTFTHFHFGFATECELSATASLYTTSTGPGELATGVWLVNSIRF